MKALRATDLRCSCLPKACSFVDISPSDPNTILLSQFATGVLRSTNQGRTWAVSNRGFLGADTYNFLPHPNGSILAPVTIYLTHFLLRGSATGQGWKFVPDAEGIQSISMHPRYQNILAGILDSYVAISSDAGATWSKRKFGNRKGVALSFDPVDPNTIYVAPEDWNDGYTIKSRGIFKTSDQGISWENVWTRHH